MKWNDLQYLPQQTHSNKNTKVYQYLTLLLHAKAYTGMPEGGANQWKEWLRVIILQICIYKAKTHVLNKLHSKMFVALNRLNVLTSKLYFCGWNASKYLCQITHLVVQDLS